jgi:hypothetical protein
MCDDAFISFRYAANLVQGHGLVFNAGERVEGYSNFLWTLWMSAGLRLGLDAEQWAAAWGVGFYAGSILLLAWRSGRRARAAGSPGVLLPIAALLAAAHGDWRVFATSGLETSMFTFLAVLGFVLLADPPHTPRRLALAGAVFALLALTRSDGVILAAPAGLFVLAHARSRLRAAAVFGGAFLVLWVPHLVWRVSYYGDLLPNTWYAKSAASAWYAQGWAYLGLYFQKYWVLAAGAGLAAVVALLAAPTPKTASERVPPGGRSEVVLAGVLLASYALWVVHVGGDFMYARLLIPVTPFLLVLTELAILRLLPAGSLPRAVALAATLAAMLFTPGPIAGDQQRHGVTNEQHLYTPDATRSARAEGERLRRYVEGLPIRMPFLGADARIVYYSGVGTAIECVTGLTDRFIARQSLSRRGRVGHEKLAPASYLLSDRKVNLALNPGAALYLGIADSLPFVTIEFDSVSYCLLRWEPELLSALRARGAQVPDFTASLDEYLAGMDSLPDSVVRADFAKLDRFYFQNVRDPARAGAIASRLRGRE